MDGDYVAERRSERDVRRAQGLCIYCGEAQADEGRVSCTQCRERLNKYARETGVCNNWLKARRRKRLAEGLCTQCGVPVEGDCHLCTRCRAVGRERLRRQRQHADLRD